VTGTVVIGAGNADTYRLTAEIKPADTPTRIGLYLLPTDPAAVHKPAQSNAAVHLHPLLYQGQADA
jgi:hypothetical protein